MFGEAWAESAETARLRGYLSTTMRGQIPARIQRSTWLTYEERGRGKGMGEEKLKLGSENCSPDEY